METYIAGFGLVCKAIGELLVDNNPSGAFTDFMKGLGNFGVQTAITKAMEQGRPTLTPHPTTPPTPEHHPST